MDCMGCGRNEIHLCSLLLINLVLLRVVSQLLCDLQSAQQASSVLAVCMRGQAPSHQDGLPKNAMTA